MSIYHQNCPPDLVPKYHIYPFLFQVFNLLCYQCWKGLLETNRKLKTHIDWDWRCLWMAQKPLRVWTELKRSHSVDCRTGASRNPSSSLQRGGSVPWFWLFLSSRSWFDLLAEQIKLLCMSSTETEWERWAPKRSPTKVLCDIQKNLHISVEQQQGDLHTSWIVQRRAETTHREWTRY